MNGIKGNCRQIEMDQFNDFIAFLTIVGNTSASTSRAIFATLPSLRINIVIEYRFSPRAVYSRINSKFSSHIIRNFSDSSMKVFFRNLLFSPGVSAFIIKHFFNMSLLIAPDNLFMAVRNSELFGLGSVTTTR